jgi:CxxC-x17-CxxC domain-containing protein
MNNFNGGGFKKGAPKFGGKKKFKDDKKYGGGKKHENRSVGQAAELFSATCSDCGKSCEVPFRPSSEKPVYCSNCFGMKKSANESRGTNHKTEKVSYQNNRPDVQQASGGRNSSSKDTTRGVGNDVITDLKRQITGLEIKLNRILDLINPPEPSRKASVQPEEKTVVKVEKSPKKVVAKKEPPTKIAAKTVKNAALKKPATKSPAKKSVKKVSKVAQKKVARSK